MFNRKNTASFNVKKYWKHGWNIDVTSKSHKYLRCSMSNWYIFDVMDDIINLIINIINVFSTGV